MQKCSEACYIGAHLLGIGETFTVQLKTLKSDGNCCVQQILSSPLTDQHALSMGTLFSTYAQWRYANMCSLKVCRMIHTMIRKLWS